MEVKPEWTTPEALEHCTIKFSEADTMTEKLPSLNIVAAVIEQAYQDEIKLIFRGLCEDVRVGGGEEAQTTFCERFRRLLKARRLADEGIRQVHKECS